MLYFLEWNAKLVPLQSKLAVCQFDFFEPWPSHGIVLSNPNVWSQTKI